ncbi:MAG TPA: hypothetical protein VF572_01820 [Candidatus Saccharimonadales bacterium]|jgi:hypothetical protein
MNIHEHGGSADEENLNLELGLTFIRDAAVERDINGYTLSTFEKLFTGLDAMGLSFEDITAGMSDEDKFYLTIIQGSIGAESD